MSTTTTTTPRIQPLTNEQADPKARGLLYAVQKKLGLTPNMMRTMAQAPAVLEGYLALNGALAGGPIDFPVVHHENS